MFAIFSIFRQQIVCRPKFEIESWGVLGYVWELGISVAHIAASLLYTLVAHNSCTMNTHCLGTADE